MRVAVASSGLGCIHRGIEAWADDLTIGLRAVGLNVTLFQGGGDSRKPERHVLPCLQRFNPITLRLVACLAPLAGWRYGAGSGYEIEQSTFAWSLWLKVKRDFDLLHVQDPWLAFLMHGLWRRGLSRPRVVLAHGTEEDGEFLRRLRFLQHLAPCYAADWESQRPKGQLVFGIPNFVDCDRFQPGDPRPFRQRLGLPEDEIVFLCVAAIQRIHKRVDFLIREFHRLQSAVPGRMSLIIAGGREAQTDEVIEEGRRLLGDRIRFLISVPRAEMAALYRAADVFVLASLNEMMPIAVLEALASGLPVVCSDTPVLQWMTDSAGVRGNLNEPGSLAALMERLIPPEGRRSRAANARQRALNTFSSEVVMAQILDMYRQVLDSR